MKKEELYKYMKLMYKNKILFLKSGTFYHTFDDDAIILSSIFNYQIINNRCSTPISNKDKVKNTLKELGIDVVFIDSSETIEEVNGDVNNYDNYILNIKEKKEFEKKIDYLNELSLNKVKENNDNYDKIIDFVNSL